MLKPRRTSTLRLATILSCLVVTVVSLVFSPEAYAAPKSFSYVQQNLENGIGTAYAGDQVSRDNVISAYNEGIRTYPGIRTRFSASTGGFSMKDWGWLSAPGAPNITTPISVTTSDRDVRMQYNAFTFMSAPSVFRSNCPNMPTIRDRAPWVRTNNHVELPPNPASDPCLGVKRENAWTRVEQSGFSVSGLPAGTTAQVIVGSNGIMSRPRDNTSRYWAPDKAIPITIRLSKPLAQTTRVTVSLPNKLITVYDHGSYKDYRCWSNGVSTGFRRMPAWSACDTYRAKLNVVINVIGYNLVPKTRLGRTGNQARAYPDVVNTSSLNSKAGTNWMLTRFTAPIGTKITPATVNESGTWSCTIYKYSNCKHVATGTATFPANRTTELPVFREPIPDGQQICYVTSVSTPTHNATPKYRHSAPNCLSNVDTEATTTHNKSADGYVEPGEVVTWRHFLKTGPYPDSAFQSSSVKVFQKDDNVEKAVGAAESTPPPSTSQGGTWIDKPYEIKESDIGKRICRYFDAVINTKTGAQPAASTTSEGVPSSGEQCVRVALNPKVQVWGHDLKVGKHFTGLSPVSDAQVRTGRTNNAIAGRTFGSWTEFATLSSGPVNTVTGGALAGRDGIETPEGDANALFNHLTFANTPTMGKFVANPERMGTIPDVLARYKSASGTAIGAAVNLSDYAPRPEPYVLRFNGNGVLNLRATGEIRAGASIIVVSNGTVNVTSDIRYAPGPYGNIRDLPQVLLLARNIAIADGVTNVDSWLIATPDSEGDGGYITTCGQGAPSGDDYTAGLKIGTCDKLLTVNGPVMAQHLWLRRTSWSRQDGFRNAPAEVLNLRPDAFLWARMQSSGDALHTVYAEDLPPRF